jgi:hypothetical protein
MEPRDFVLFLHGVLEASPEGDLSEKTTQLVKDRLNTVFMHVVTEKKAKSEVRFPSPRTEEEAISRFGPKPGDQYRFNMHGWYDPKFGIPKC